MDKKKLTSWGVSFGSLALVAGMVGYLGITNKNTTSNSTIATAQTQVVNQSSNQTSASGNNLTLNQTTNNSGLDQSSSGHHGNFDTTTGGS